MTIGYEFRSGILYLNVTNRCSNECTFCVRQGPGFSLAGHDMHLEREPTAGEVLEDIDRKEKGRGSPFDEYVFCGFGEPTHRLDLISMVGRALRGRERWVRLNTNGQAALISRRDPLPDLEGALDEISISLNAPDAMSYMDLCRPGFGKAAFPAVLDLARRCVGRFSGVTLTVVGFVLEEEDLRRCRELASEIGARFRVR